MDFKEKRFVGSFLIDCGKVDVEIENVGGWWQVVSTYPNGEVYCQRYMSRLAAVTEAMNAVNRGRSAEKLFS
jgi:hypothetical protein